MNGIPALTSSDQGGNTFSTSMAFEFGSPLSWHDGWSAKLQARSIRLFFHPQAICAGRRNAAAYSTNWASSHLTLTVVTDTAPIFLTPLPGTHKGKSYSWYSASVKCNQLPHLMLTLPASPLQYLSDAAYASTIGGIHVSEILGWSYPIISVVFALVVCLFIRRFLTEQKFVLNIILLAFLGVFPAAISFDFSSNGLWSTTELLTIYAIAVVIMYRLRSPGGWLAVPAAVVAIAVIGIVAVRKQSVVLPAAAIVQEALALVLVIAIGVLGCREARSFQVGGANDIKPWLDVNYLRDVTVFWAGAALMLTVWCGLGGAFDPSSPTGFVFSEFAALRYLLAAFAVVLVAVALTIPFVSRGLSADGVLIAAALLGFSYVAQFPTLTVSGIAIPGGEILFVFLLYRFAVIRKEDTPKCDKSSTHASRLRACLPRESLEENTILAIKISAALAVVPVSYFIYTTVTSLPKALQQSGLNIIFVVPGILGQLVGWIIIGIVFAGLTPRLRGGIGPVRALIVSSTWFVAALIIHVVDRWLGEPTAQSWSFFGLELFLFLAAFGVIWDAYVLTSNPWKKSLKPLRQAYQLRQARTVVLYAVPLLLAIIVFGQQLSSGNGIESVKSALSIGPAIFGG
jgi:hypothetical protein